ncbi:MAG: septum site-determining protein MinC [Clostridiales bacterium]|jgi:septum site-determining protein MinC|nr:septum site-determining protein MinC [Clostridiales bacterium]
MARDTVIFKNTGESFLLVLNSDCDFNAILERIAEKLESNRNFYKGSTLSLLYSGRDLSKNEEQKINELFTNNAGANITDISNTDRLNKPHEADKKEIPVQKIISYSKEGMTKFHQGTLRSGQAISYRGNVVIFGDINPGAEVIATGNIVVLGFVKGIVRAGVEGDIDSVIVAQGLHPTLISIGEIISRSPEEEGNKNLKSEKLEIAYLKDYNIYIKS